MDFLSLFRIALAVGEDQGLYKGLEVDALKVAVLGEDVMFSAVIVDPALVPAKIRVIGVADVVVVECAILVGIQKGFLVLMLIEHIS